MNHLFLAWRLLRLACQWINRHISNEVNIFGASCIMTANTEKWCKAVLLLLLITVHSDLTPTIIKHEAQNAPLCIWVVWQKLKRLHKVSVLSGSERCHREPKRNTACTHKRQRHAWGARKEKMHTQLRDFLVCPFIAQFSMFGSFSKCGCVIFRLIYSLLTMRYDHVSRRVEKHKLSQMG